MQPCRRARFRTPSRVVVVTQQTVGAGRFAVVDGHVSRHGIAVRFICQPRQEQVFVTTLPEASSANGPRLVPLHRGRGVLGFPLQR